MTDRTPAGEDPVDDEVLAAYLDGETDEVTSTRLGRRLATDAALAARLDAIADVRARVQRLDDVRAPGDVRDRLRARLAADRADRADPGPAATDATTGPGAPADAPVGTADRAAGRRWRVPPWAAAAVIAVVAVAVLGAAAVALLGLGASDSGGEAGSAAVAEGPATTADGGDGADAGSASRDDGPGAMGGTAEGAPSAVPRVDDDRQVVARVRRRAARGDDPVATERTLRRRAGLPTDQICARGMRARGVDLVERDGRTLLVLLTGGDEPQVVVIDPRTCAPERTIPATGTGG